MRHRTAPRPLLRNQPNPRPLHLLVYSIRQREVRLVPPAVRVADDRRHLEAAGEVERCRWVVERQLDIVAAADVQRQLDARVHLRLVHLREEVVVAPVEGEERAGLDGVRRVHPERIQPVTVQRQTESSFANSIATDDSSQRPFVPLMPTW